MPAPTDRDLGLGPDRAATSTPSGRGLLNFRSSRRTEPAPAPAAPRAPAPVPDASYLPDPSALLRDLAPSILSSSSRLLHPANLHAHQQSLEQQQRQHDPSAIESLRRKLGFLRTGLAIDSSNVTTSWAQLGHDLYIRDRVDELLRLPVPPTPFAFTSSAPATRMIDAPAPAPPPRPDHAVPLLQGFQATIPTANQARVERRRRRALESEHRLGLRHGARLGLKERGDRARGLLNDVVVEEQDERDDDDLSRIGRRRKPPLAAHDAHAPPSRNELEGDLHAVGRDMNNVKVRRALLNSQIRDVDAKIKELEQVRDGFRKGLLGLREEELELEDELEGIQATLARLPLATMSDPTSTGSASTTSRTTLAAGAPGAPAVSSSSSRRRKGPAFLPSEHDDLPTSVAFMTLHGHLAPVTSLDFSAPYQTLVTSSADASVRLWDLTTGDATGYLKGHDGVVKVLQVEGTVAVTGGKDGRLKVWDLERAQEEFVNGGPPAPRSGTGAGAARGDDSIEEDVFGTTTRRNPGAKTTLVNGSTGYEEDGLLREEGAAAGTIYGGVEPPLPEDEDEGSCVRTLDGHTKAVTSLYFDGPTLLTGSSDSTLRQWDLNTGQCVLTMDILWALSNPNPASSTHYPASSYSSSTVDPFAESFSTSSSAAYDGGGPTTPRKTFSSLRRQSSLFDSSPGAVSVSSAMDRTYYSDGSWEPYEDFVGGIQFWGYALASGTRDGCVRMWDMRTGQAHRTLIGHTGPVTSVQFDEYHLVSGSLDKSIRIWDLRTGSISDTIKYDYPITALQFDNRKIVSAAGENGVKVYNRTTLEHSTLAINGHTGPVERLRFMDKYLATGSRDCTVKIWALP
ncbi:hypothetical protein JCM11491_005942 [Sporobolomyces phaffii]